MADATRLVSRADLVTCAAAGTATLFHRVRFRASRFFLDAPPPPLPPPPPLSPSPSPLPPPPALPLTPSPPPSSLLSSSTFVAVTFSSRRRHVALARRVTLRYSDPLIRRASPIVPDQSRRRGARRRVVPRARSSSLSSSRGSSSSSSSQWPAPHGFVGKQQLCSWHTPS